MENGQENKKANKQALATMYSSLMSLFIHQDSLHWRHVNVIAIIQVAVLTGGYTMRSTMLSPLLMVFGALLTVIMYLFTVKDQWDRDVNLRVMDRLAELCLADALGEDYRDSDTKRIVSLISDPPKKLPWFRNRKLFAMALALVIALNIILACVFPFLH